MVVELPAIADVDSVVELRERQRFVRFPEGLNDSDTGVVSEEGEGLLGGQLSLVRVHAGHAFGRVKYFSARSHHVRFERMLVLL